MAAYGNASVAAAPSTTLDVTDYGATTIHNAYGEAKIATMGEEKGESTVGLVWDGAQWKPLLPNFTPTPPGDSSLPNEARWLANSLMVVTDNTNPEYAAMGYPSPKQGYVIRNSNVVLGTLRDGRQWTPDTAETLLALLDYEQYEIADILALGLMESIYDKTQWGQTMTFIAEGWFPGTPYFRADSEAHSRTACLAAHALARYSLHNNAPMGPLNRTPRQAAIDLLFPLRRTQLVSADRIAASEQPTWTAGAIYEYWNNAGEGGAITPQWTLLSLFCQDVLEEAVSALAPFGTSVTTSSGIAYSIEDVRSQYKSFLDECYLDPNLMMPCNLPHQRIQLPGDGSGIFVNWYTPGTTPPNPIGHNATWTTDAMGWMIRGRALAGKPITTLTSAFKSLLVGTPPRWYDAYNADGSQATDGEVSSPVTQASALVYLAEHDSTTTTPDASLLDYPKQTQLDKPGNLWGDGGWTWTGEEADHVEAVATAVILRALLIDQT